MPTGGLKRGFFIDGDTVSPSDLYLRFGISREEIASFHQSIRIYPAGEVIIWEGEVDHSLFLIRCGKVDVLKKSSENKQERLGSIEAVNFVGEMSVINDEPRSATVVAAGEEVLIYSITRPNLGLILANPKWSELLIARLAKNLAQSNTDKVSSVSQIDTLQTQVRQLQADLDEQTKANIALRRNIQRTFSTILFFEQAVQDLSVTGSRSWMFLKSFREVSHTLVERWMPGLGIDPENADVDTLLICLRVMNQKVSGSISNDLIEWLQNNQEK
ncbi:MAG: cyclic nucleotide-binding domain-containing protein [Anaerolineaceae bacterium]|nr:cyclic nucleotide-binding domain-containing protein [Anaerolineaceae bacterium]